MRQLLTRLRNDFPQISFSTGKQFCWSPQTAQVFYKSSADGTAAWSLLHEVGHAVLGHKSYASDFELVQLEMTAWTTAEALAEKYGITIDEDHIQDCLDTYRDWLHRRSTCPTCGIRSLQQSIRSYVCFNCKTNWRVSASRFCRPYRRLAPSNLRSGIQDKKQSRYNKSETFQSLFM